MRIKFVDNITSTKVYINPRFHAKVIYGQYTLSTKIILIRNGIPFFEKCIVILHELLHWAVSGLCGIRDYNTYCYLDKLIDKYIR